MSNSLSQTHTKSPVRTILIAGLIVGTLDIAAASIQTLINGRDPMMMLKFIASGIFGPSAMAGDVMYSIYGLFFHYCIAMIWTVIFFTAYSRMGIMSKNRLITGVVYGFFVQLCMAFVVLPLANTPPLPFKFWGMIKSGLILVVAIGIPLSYIAYGFYKNKKETE